MDPKVIEAMLVNHNRVMSAVYQSLMGIPRVADRFANTGVSPSDLDWERERDYHAEELALENRSFNHERY